MHPLSISINMERSHFFSESKSNGRASRSSVEPEHEGLGCRVLVGLEEPVEERRAARLADGDVPGVLREAGVEGLPGDPRHPVPRLLLPPAALPGGGDRNGGQQQGDEEPEGPGGSGAHRGGGASGLVGVCGSSGRRVVRHGGRCGCVKREGRRTVQSRASGLWTGSISGGDDW